MVHKRNAVPNVFLLTVSICSAFSSVDSLCSVQLSSSCSGGDYVVVNFYLFRFKQNLKNVNVSIEYEKSHTTFTL